MTPILYFGGSFIPRFIFSKHLIQSIYVLAILLPCMLSAQDNEKPIITSGSWGAVSEHNNSGQVVYVLTATDNVGVTRSYLQGTDAHHFLLNSDTGEVTFNSVVDFENKPSYGFEVVVWDAGRNYTIKAVRVLVENDPTDDPEGLYIIKQQNTAVSLGTNFLPKVIYTDSGGLSGNYGQHENSVITFLAQPSETIAVTFLHYSVERRWDDIEVSSAANASHNMRYNEGTKPPTLFSNEGGRLTFRFRSDTNVHEAGWEAYVLTSADGFRTPVILFPSTSLTIKERSGAGQVIFQAEAIDDVAVTDYVLGGADANHFTVSTSGEVTLTDNPDFETKSSYTITVAAQDADGHTSEPITINLNITSVAEITSGNRTTAVLEHSEAGQVVYTLTARHFETITNAYIEGSDADHFSLNAETGEVTFNSVADFETKPSYEFTIWIEDVNDNSDSKLVRMPVKNDPADDPDEGHIIRHQELSVFLGTEYSPRTIYTDSGGQSEDYSSRERSTLTFYAEPGETVGVVFFSFNVEGGAYDYLDVSNIANQSQTIRYGTIKPTTLFSEEGGSLSFFFRSDSGIERSGWEAYVMVSDDGFSTPVMMSPAATITIKENSGARQVVYRAKAIDATAVSGYVLAGEDASHFSVASNGQVTLIANPDYETKSSYAITVAARDTDGNISDPVSVNLIITSEPEITSGNMATAVLEHSEAGQVVYTLTAKHFEEVTSSGIQGPDASHFSFNDATNEVTFNSVADFETKSEYLFTIWIDDGNGSYDSKLIRMLVKNDPTDDPQDGHVIRHQELNMLLGTSFLPRVTYTDSGGLDEYYSNLEDSTLTFFAESGETLCVAFLNFNTESGYDFLTVSNAADASQNIRYAGYNQGPSSLFSEESGSLTFHFISDRASTRTGWEAVVLASNDGFNTPVMITSDATVTINENSGARQVVYRAQAIDRAGISNYVLGGEDASHFSVANNGQVTLIANPDYETKSSYTITVAALDDDENISEVVNVNVVVIESEIPKITSGDLGTNLIENTGTNQVVYTTVAKDNIAVTTYTLTGTDADKLSISETGVVTLIADPDFETQFAYFFNVVVGDADGNIKTQPVRFYVENNLAFESDDTTADVEERTLEVGTFL